MYTTCKTVRTCHLADSYPLAKWHVVKVLQFSVFCLFFLFWCLCLFVFSAFYLFQSYFACVCVCSFFFTHALYITVLFHLRVWLLQSHGTRFTRGLFVISVCCLCLRARWTIPTRHALTSMIAKKVRVSAQKVGPVFLWWVGMWEADTSPMCPGQCVSTCARYFVWVTSPMCVGQQVDTLAMCLGYVWAGWQGWHLSEGMASAVSQTFIPPWMGGTWSMASRRLLAVHPNLPPRCKFGK